MGMVTDRFQPHTGIILAEAEALTRRRSKFTYLLARALINPSVRPYYFLWYAYFRTADDIVDSALRTPQHKEEYLIRQFTLLSRLYEGEDPRNLAEETRWEEQALSKLVEFDRTRRGSRLRGPITDLLSCMRYDTEREGVVPDGDCLDRYIRIEVTSYLFTLQYFCCGPNVSGVPAADAGVAGKWVHILRDMFDDLQHGTINISEQDLVRYGLDVRSLREAAASPAVRRWVAVKARRASVSFTVGWRDLRQSRCLKYKIAVAVLCAKYKGYLAAIQRNDFILKPTYTWGKGDTICTIVLAGRLIGEVGITHIFTRLLRLVR